MRRKLKCKHDALLAKMSQIQAELNKQSTAFEGMIKTNHFEEPVDESLDDCEKVDADVQSPDSTRQTRDVAFNKILQLAKKLSELKGKCGRLNASRNWFSTRYHWAVRYFRRKSMTFPYSWNYSLGESIRVRQEPPQLVPISEIRQCLVDNCTVSRDWYRYSDAFKMFTLSIPSLSDVAYEFR
jgi:hypothetical protein